MARLNVRCCCQPKKILGTLEVPDEMVKDGGRLRVRIPPDPVNYGELRGRLSEPPTIETIEIRRLSLGCSLTELERRMARFEPPPADELAVYSEERPIEFWRKVRGFQEAT